MKAIKYIVCGAFVLAMTGCKGFFDTNSPSAMDASNVFSNPEYTEQAIAAVYELMGENNSYRNRIACNHVGLNTDIEYGTLSTGKTSEKELTLYDCGISNDRIAAASGKDIWGYLNTAIERCNNAIEGIEQYADLNNAQMKYYLGEVYFLRSWAYLEMVKYWGDVPARFVSIAADMNGVNAKKADRNEVFDHLRVDLKKAADYLPWSSECPGAAKNNVSRPSKAAALALLARADLMYAGKAVRPGTDGFDINDLENYAVTFNIKDAGVRAEVYKEALEACAEIINKENFKLQADYEKVFRDVCADKLTYSDMEQIWVMPFKDGARGQVLRYNSPKISSDMGSTSATALGPMAGHLKGYNGASSNSNVCVMPTFYYSFDKADKRRDVTVAPYQWTYDKGEGISKTDKDLVASLFPGVSADAARLYQKPNQMNTFYLSKYRWEWLEGRTVTYGQDDGVDFPVLRYADVLLMFAEAEIGGIGGDKPVNETNLAGIQQLNEVRRRAGLADATVLDMEAIMNERAFEFCGELVRKWDLMRWGVLREKLVKTAADMELLAREASRHQMNIGDSLYYDFKQVDLGGGCMAWVIDMDKAWGLHVGEKSDNKPANCPTARKALFDSDSKGYLLTNNVMPIYSEEAKLESRQYWPIFSYNLTASNGTLWNNYGYK
ncbi:MAG: RagB/SusD family nutrient uptake outer membrane protein [Paludibacteraceae bacterium]|nr:RagB/SusD family nutrient uptake outer membrane protein [Paludibacteraceae bacterium]